MTSTIISSCSLFLRRDSTISVVLRFLGCTWYIVHDFRVPPKLRLLTATSVSIGLSHVQFSILKAVPIAYAMRRALILWVLFA